MSILHDTFKRGFDSMQRHLHSGSLPTSDSELRNFVGYCWVWTHIINHHNDTEELIFIPWASTKLDFLKEHEQHEALHGKIDRIHEYLEEALKDVKKFDDRAFSAMLDEVKEPLYTHLDEEVADLAPERMKVFTAAEIQDFNQRMGDHLRKTDDPSIALCYLKAHMPADVKDQFPPNLPWFVRKLLVPYVFGWKYSR